MINATHCRRWPLLLVASWVFLAAQAAGATRIDLDQNWLFRTDPDQSGTASGWPTRPPAGTELVNAPHTWNVGKHHDYLGVAWYFRRFAAPAQSANQQVELNFDATFYSARV